MKTNEEVMALASQIQEKSSSNVNVSVDFTLGGYGTKWGVQLLVINPTNGGIATYIYFSPYDDIGRLELLAKHGYNSQVAALNSSGIPKTSMKTITRNIWDFDSELNIKDGEIQPREKEA